MKPLKLAFAMSLLAAPALAKTAPAACPASLHPATSAEIVFSGDEAVVSYADWRAFVDSEVMPRFPASLPVSDVYQAGGKGPFARQQARAVLVVLTGADRERDKVHAIRDAYRDRFRHQQAVILESPACVAF
ncbi:MAG: DUF3574 domain-containing protein [Proteobacteria bacterium]|nr:DUF3574 domain-containing protein [Pseudomonadota bacterium]